MKNGKYLLYDQQGNCVLDLNYKNDEFNGLQKIFFEADENADLQSFFGVKFIENALEQGRKVENYCGSPTIIVNYINGKKDGLKKVYECKPSYQLKKEVIYKDGSTTQTKYFNIFVKSEDYGAKQVRYLSAFSNSYSIEDIDYQLKNWVSGEVYQYYKNGKVAIKKDNADLKVYDKTGTLLSWEINGKTNIYSNGQVIKSGDTVFFENGKVKSIGNHLIFYENGIKKKNGDTTFYQTGQIDSIGISISFYETGIKRHHYDTTFFENGKIATIGKDIAYYDNGNLKTDGVNKYFENGKPEYTKDAIYERTYDHSGQLLVEKNLSTGKYIENYPNGQPKIVASYNKKEKLDGWYQKFNENGDLTEYTFYAKGEKQTVNMKTVYLVPLRKRPFF